ncbi:uncharacterized protein PAE49_004977 [Odontesthes bonariensis]|uniref:uncharacterized protein LOC142380478 n=1 Tax=Odontesthes bonariensis TaxID=219752 RepID=UPI003F584C9F
MAAYHKIILWSISVFLTAAEKASVIHPFTSACAVRGSTLTLPCTFTPAKSFIRDGKRVPLKIIRVGWCQNHEICQDFFTSVYDSDSENNDPRYQYLGDKKANCTLQITDLQPKDDATFRFRMQADDLEGHFTNRTGVKVTVADGTKLWIKGSRDNRTFSGGEAASLLCTSTGCTFHQLKISWFRDGRPLPESGPVLRLGPLTAEDSGNYTCALETNINTQSEPYSLQVEAGTAEGGQGLQDNLFWIFYVVFGVLLAVITLILVVFCIKRKRAAAEVQSPAGGERHQKQADDIYSSIMPTEENGGNRANVTSREVEDVSYASVQFRHNKQSRHVEEAGDAIIYSSVATRG